MTRRIVLAAMWLLLSATPAFAGSGAPGCDEDGVSDTNDNCLCNSNPNQDDTDGDFCGNVCDADYDQNGIVGLSDFGQFAQAFGSRDQEKCHREPIAGCTVGLDDFGIFAQRFNTVPGPSGTTPGTVACP